MIMIFMAKGTPRDLLICRVALLGLSHVGTITPILCQQFLAKEHLKTSVLAFPPSEECKVHKSRILDAYSSSLTNPSCLVYHSKATKRKLYV
jgi:hypothetical protein